MLYPEIIHMTVEDHTTSKGKPRSGVGGDQRPGALEQRPSCKNERLERVELLQLQFIRGYIELIYVLMCL